MMKSRLPIFILFVLGLSSCSTLSKVDYTLISVPEEGGLKFTKYTRDNDNVLGPTVSYVDKKIYWYAAPFLSVSSNQVAYTARKETTNDNIYLKKTAGGRMTVQRTFRNNASNPSFSPDDSKIVFCDNPEGATNIYMIDAEKGAAVQQITNSQLNDTGPVFSPDGKKIFFSKQESIDLKDGSSIAQYNVWSFELSSSLLTQFTRGFTPAFVGNDNDKLIVTRMNKSSKLGEIWMIEIESGRETLLMADSEKGFSSPNVSPDGKTIVCVGTTKDSKTRPLNLDLYTFNLDGTGLTQLTYHGAADVSPQFSPDGKSIFFISSRGSETKKGRYNVWKLEF